MPLVLAEVEALVAILDKLDGQPIRLLVTGSRTWADEEAVHRVLQLVGWAAIPNNVTLVHGKAKDGLDLIADEWAAQQAGSHWTVEPYPVTKADWDRHGRAAGQIRNGVMVRDGADLCCAWIKPCESPRCTRPRPHGSHGASGCADLAAKAGIPTWRCER
jgi:hypothetical protein